MGWSIETRHDLSQGPPWKARESEGKGSKSTGLNETVALTSPFKDDFNSFPTCDFVNFGAVGKELTYDRHVPAAGGNLHATEQIQLGWLAKDQVRRDSDADRHRI
eukprot:5052774-Pleurochrysis_carterae.AAC.1